MTLPNTFAQVPFGKRQLDLCQVHVMGVLNVTPDSFSDGGQFNERDAALRQAEQMLASGASIIDVGGESTRPGAAPVSLEEEMDRVCPVVEALIDQLDACVSVDTSSPVLMREAISLGVGMINDVRAFRRDGAMAAVASAQDVALCVMHMQGEPDTMQQNPSYRALINDVASFLESRCESLLQAGVDRQRIVLDPGFGFGKTLTHNLLMLGRFNEFLSLGYPLLAGLSRKSMFGALLDKPVEERMIASVVGAGLAAEKGASIVRVHDVEQTMDAVRLVNALRNLEN
ncbi:MAG: dihydropteroate synthase [Oleiphilaceae bacterium]|nr:dihydropteroate synthase [Oleiphilaceae bacterium]